MLDLAMAKPRNLPRFQQVQQVTARPGEGTVIASVAKRIAHPDGTTTIALQLNLNTAQVPDRRYAANAASLVHEGDRVTFIFGHRRLGRKELRSLVLVEMITPAVHQLLESSKAMLVSAWKFVAKNELARTSLAEINEDVPGQTVPFIANICTAGFTGRDACMDFYFASPFAAQIAGGGGDFQAEPLVRVSMPTMLMLAIYERLKELEPSLPRDKEPEEAS